MMYGLAFWIPYFGHFGGQLNQYQFRSCMYPSVTMAYAFGFASLLTLGFPEMPKA